MPAQPLLPRFRQPLGVGAMVDETMRFYRQSWRTVVTVMAIATAPATLLNLAAIQARLLPQPDLFVATPFVGATPAVTIVATVIVGLVAGLMSLIGSLVVALILDGWARGVSEPARDLFGQVMRRLLPILVSGLLYLLGVSALMLVSIPALVLWAIVGLGGLVPFAGAIVWWVRPTWRPRWLRTLIIMTTPFGLPMYYGLRWSLLWQAALFEGAGPTRAISRSSELVRGNWFPVFGVVMLISVVTGILSMLLGAVVALGGALVGVALAATGDTQAPVAFATLLANFLATVLFGALPVAASTLLFLDLRNRHEGSDIAERVALLEHQASAPSM